MAIGGTGNVTTPIPVPGGTTTTTTVAPTPQQTSVTGSTTPPGLFALRFTGLSAAQALGLAPPSGNIGDFEAVLAEIASKLKETESTTRDNQEVADSNRRRTDMARAAAIFTKLAALGDIIIDNEINIKAQKVKIDDIDSQLGPLKTQRDGLQGTINSLNNTINVLGTQMNGVYNQITGLNTQLNGAYSAYYAATTDAGRAAALTQINSLSSQINNLWGTYYSLSSQRDGLISTRDSTQTTLNGINGQISTLEAQKTAAENSIKDSQGKITSAILQMLALILSSMFFVVSVLMEGKSELARIAGKTTDYIDGFEDTLSGVLDQITDRSEDMTRLEFLQEGVAAGLNTAQQSALGFAAAVASLIGTLEALTGQEAPQSARALAEQGSSRSRVSV